MASYAEGVYQCKVTGQGFGESKTKGTPFFYLDIQPEYQIINNELHDLPEDCRWVRRFERYLSDNTFEYFLEDMKSIGWEGGALSDLGPEGSTSFLGAEIKCRCVHEAASDGSGKVYERWMLWRPTSGGIAAPEKTLDKTGLRKLDAMFGDKLKSAFGAKAKPASKPAAKPAPKQAETVPPGEPADIPF